MKESNTVKTWEKTRLQNLVRHKSKRYYARLFLNGKEIWKSLKTSHFSIAEGKLGEIKKEHRKRRNTEIKPGDAKMTMLQAVTLRMKYIEEGVKIKSSILSYWKEIKAALLKSWNNADSKEVRRITAADCREWASAYAKVASPNRFNNTVSFLRHAFQIAVEGGVIYANPTRVLERLPVRGKIPELPTLAKFEALIVEMKNGHGRDSKNCTDFAQGLAYTVMRLGEAGEVIWADLRFTDGKIFVRGDAEGAIMNGDSPSLNFEVRHEFMGKEAVIGCFVSMSFSGSVVQVVGDGIALGLG